MQQHTDACRVPHCLSVPSCTTSSVSLLQGPRTKEVYFSTAANTRNLHKIRCKSLCSFQHSIASDCPHIHLPHPLPAIWPSAKGWHDCLGRLWPLSSSDRSTVNIQSMAGRHSPAPPPPQSTQPLDSRQPAAKLGFPFHSIKDNYSIHAPHPPASDTWHPLSGETLGKKGRKGSLSLLSSQKLWFQLCSGSCTQLGCPLLTARTKFWGFPKNPESFQLLASLRCNFFIFSEYMKSRNWPFFPLLPLINYS